MRKKSLKGHSDLIVLSALAVRPMHGYMLSEYLKQQMPEAFSFGAGMIYPVLHKLEQKQLIKGEWKEFAGTKRRVYTLTRQGRKMHETKKREWQTFSRLMTKVIGHASTCSVPMCPPRI